MEMGRDPREGEHNCVKDVKDVSEEKHLKHLQFANQDFSW